MRWPSGDAEGACAKEWESHFSRDTVKILTLSKWLRGGLSLALSLSACLGPLGDTFRPVYPKRLWIEEQVFCGVFPFHLVFDEAVRAPFFQKLGLGAKAGINSLSLWLVKT